MPIIFFIISLFLANQTAITISPKSDFNSKETVKTTDTPSDGREYVIINDIYP